MNWLKGIRYRWSKQRVTAIEDITVISEQSAAGTQGTSTSTQQVGSAIDEVSNSSSEVAVALAEDLNR